MQPCEYTNNIRATTIAIDKGYFRKLESYSPCNGTLGEKATLVLSMCYD
jgi:hypothetical protein